MLNLLDPGLFHTKSYSQAARALQECFRTQVQRYLEPLTRLPELMARSATVLPIVDASPPRALPTPRGPSGEEVQGIVAAELQSAVASLMDAQVLTAACACQEAGCHCWSESAETHRALRMQSGKVLL